MPAEIHKQILDYQGGDANAALELVEKFKPLIKRYAFFLHREDSFEDLQCFLLSMLKTWDTSRLSSTDDATVTRYIANSVKNEYIALSKQKAKERGTSYLEDATLPQALEYAQKTSTCDQCLLRQFYNFSYFHSPHFSLYKTAISPRRVAQRQSTVGLNSSSIFICCSFLWVKTELPKASYI